jgi:outer membrane lipoprotein SlyB
VESVVRTFSSPLDAGRAVRELEAAGVPRARLLVLTPNTSPTEIERRVPSEPGESPGMGAALGAVVGGSIGLSAAALVLPGVGPVVAMGILVAGIIGAAGGGVAGETLEEHLTRGVAGQDLENARRELRNGNTVVIVLAENPEEADTARTTLDAAAD